MATALSKCTGLSDRTHFPVGDATATGLPDEAVDAALTVHVAMNISDKPAISEVDSSDESLVWFHQVRAGIERDGPPPVTFAAFLGDAFGHRAANQVANLAERRIRTVMFACSRPM